MYLGLLLGSFSAIPTDSMLIFGFPQTIENSCNMVAVAVIAIILADPLHI